jgi:DNA-binding beta-propeller fold protein YncE/thiol-disulfide isomerase/thioredoxin
MHRLLRAAFIVVLLSIGHSEFHHSVAAQDEIAGQDPPENPFPQAIQIPAGILDGGSEWFNTAQPLSLKDLRGKIVLLDFWTYCCINCMHVLPDLKYLEDKYGDQLVVIGVHSAKFDNEKIGDNIRDAIMRYEIHHPVVNDDQMVIWQKFGTRSWPTLALVDPEGRYIGSQSGEGNRQLFDGVITRLIDYHRAKGTLDETPLRFELEEFTRPTTALRYPGKILFDSSSHRLFITDTGHNRIVVCDDSGSLLSIIGSGQIGRADGSFSNASFDHPQGVALAGNMLYVADTDNHLIRIVDLQQGQVATFAGTGKQGRPAPDTRGRLKSTALNSPWDLEIIGDRMFIAMAGPHQIWSHRLASNDIGVFAGSGREDVLNGLLPQAAFAQPSDIVAGDDGTALFVADSEGSAIRQLTSDPTGDVTTIAGTSELPRGQSLFAFGDVDGIGAAARLQHPLGLTIDGSTLFVADSYNHRIKQIDLNSDQVESWLGTGKAGKRLEPVEFNEPGGLAISSDALWVADTNNHRILAVNRTSKAATELTIEGLAPPSPPNIVNTLDSEDAIAVPSATVNTLQPLVFRVTLNVPEGYKFNDLAPVTWEAFVVGPQVVIAPESLGVRDEAQVNGHEADFTLPLTGEQGESEIVIRMNYGYCSDLSSVCRLAQASWKIRIAASEDSDVSELQLAFPITAESK